MQIEDLLSKRDIELLSSISLSPKEMEIKSTVVVFGGKLIRFSHSSTETGTPMTCSVFLPSNEGSVESSSFPYLLYLSGLTCTDENVCQKSGVFKKLAELKVIVFIPLLMLKNINKTIHANRLHS